MKSENNKVLLKNKITAYLLSGFGGALSALILGVILTQVFLGYPFNLGELMKILLMSCLLYLLPSLVLNLFYFSFNGDNKEKIIIPHVLCSVLYLIITVSSWKSGGDFALMSILFTIINLIIGTYLYKKRSKIFNLELSN